MKQAYIYIISINDIDYGLINMLHEKQRQRIEGIKNEKAKKQALASELALLYAVKKFKPKDVPIPPMRAKREHGKPYFEENTDFHFSISHSGSYAVVAVADDVIGVDIEKISPEKARVFKRVLSDKEQDVFLNLGYQEQINRFFELWVLKESITKASGKGLYQSFSKISISFNDKNKPYLKTDNKNTDLILKTMENDGYKIGLCIFSKKKYKIFTKILSYIEIIM